ncbi:hypothetical protein MVEN_02207800 [Mycena venus]|uniref:Uncharacterized protein n=1 Tax=Mycena venus TaxID=2733690 RepID=A0A8H6X7M7_9AGAR|nr:hypothetical protein MVEN_02207800 [Mycena venus]
MQQFLLESTSDLIHSSVATRRQIACLKAIWAMAAMSDTDIIISDSISSFDAQLLASSSALARNPGLCDYLPSVRAILLWNLFRSFSHQTNTIRSILKRSDGILLAGDMLRQEMRSIAEKVLQLSAYVYAHRGKDLRILAKMGLHGAWSQDVLAILDESQESWNEIPYHIILRFLAEAAEAPAPYEFEATCNIISGLPGGHRWENGRSTAVKESAEALIIELINSNIDMLRHTPSVHHIDIALGHLLSISHRDSHRSTTFIDVVVTYLTQRNCRSALLCVLNRYQVNLLWPRIASRMNKRTPNFEDAYVQAMWQLASIGLEYTDNQTPYDVNFEFWVLSAINENTPAYASTMVLVKLNILSGLYRRHFESPLVADELLRHPLISATGILKEERLGLNDSYMDDLDLFRSACIEAHVISVTDFLLACSSPILPYRAAETLSYITFPDFRPVDNSHRGAQILLGKSVQRVIRSQLATTSQISSNPPLLERIVSMLNRNIYNVLTDLGARCTITDAILEAEEAKYQPVGTFE